MDGRFPSLRCRAGECSEWAIVAAVIDWNSRVSPPSGFRLSCLRSDSKGRVRLDHRDGLGRDPGQSHERLWLPRLVLFRHRTGRSPRSSRREDTKIAQDKRNAVLGQHPKHVFAPRRGAAKILTTVRRVHAIASGKRPACGRRRTERSKFGSLSAEESNAIGPRLKLTRSQFFSACLGICCRRKLFAFRHGVQLEYLLDGPQQHIRMDRLGKKLESLRFIPWDLEQII